jgi:AcrR family transcriptional regulator
LRSLWKEIDDGEFRRPDHSRGAEALCGERLRGNGIRDIAEAVNLSSAALYHYIGTKDDLLFKIMCDSLHAWIVGDQSRVRRGFGLAQQLAAFVRLHVMYEGHYQLRSVVIDSDLRSLQGERRNRVIALRDQYEGVLAALLRPASPMARSISPIRG